MLISVDLDSTLNDLMFKWIDYVNQKNGTSYTVSSIKSFYDPIFLSNIEFVYRKDLYDIIEPLPGAAEFMQNLQKEYDVQILTVTLDEHEKSKDKFIERYFPGVKVQHVRNESKSIYTEKGILIDDKVQTIEEHIKSGGVGLVFNYKSLYRYNLSDYPTIYDYDEAYSYIKNTVKN